MLKQPGGDFSHKIRISPEQLRIWLQGGAPSDGFQSYNWDTIGLSAGFFWDVSVTKSITVNFFGITVSSRGKRISIIRGSLVRQLPSYGRWSWLTFTPSCQPNHCQPHHHVNPIIKKLGSVVVRSVWTHGWKHSRARNLAFFSGNVALEVAQVESLLPRFTARSGKVVDKERTEL